MEWLSGIFSMQFAAALASIVVIDLVLAGDNAILIAMAARNLPPPLQKRAIVWGAAGAIVVRALMTLAVVWLLKIPGLMLAGGFALVWIAWKLLADDNQDDGEHGPASLSLWGAMKTIIIADAVMGIDNVLAIAGASHGNFLLVVLGLLISVPVVVWGSSFVLKLIGRFPIIIYGGAAVLAYTAAHMIVAEPLIKPVFSEMPALAWTAYIAVFAVVLGGGWLAQRRRQPAPAISKR